MREIKFRAWDKSNCRFLSTPLVCIDFENDCVNSYEVEQVSDTDCVQIQNTCFEYELMQYTGLKDKNGKEIYEGDIVKNSINDILEVLWCDDRCGFEMRGRYDKSHVIKQLDCDIIIDLNVEVIGNIYENPELLKDTP